MSYQPYPKYKESGVEWLGRVPGHWDVKRVGYYFNERREKVSDKDYPPLSVTKDGIVPQIETAAKTDDGDNRKKVCRGDFVINSRSDRNGSSGVSEFDGSVSLINTVLSPKPYIHPTFVHHLLRSQPFQEEFYRWGKGIVADLWSTKYSEMRSILVGMPPLADQSTIASFLDRETGRIDTLIAEQEKLITLLQEKRQALISLTVTKGLKPNIRMKPSGIEWLGNVPEHWSINPVSYRYNVQLGKMLDTAKIEGNHLRPYLRVFDVQWGNINTEDLPQMDFDEDAREKFRLIPGDLLINEGGSYPGRAAIWNGDLEECYFQKALHRLRPLRPSEDSTRFFYYVIFWAATYGVFTARGNETTIEHLPAEKLRSYRFAFPKITEQEQIAAYLDRKMAELDALKAEAQRAIALLKERRSALISAAVTGKIDVRANMTLLVPEPAKAYSIGFARQLLAAEILYHCYQYPTTGRVKLQKLIQLCEGHAQIEEIDGHYVREAAGPFDSKLMHSVVVGLKKQKWFEAVRSEGRTVYQPLEKMGGHVKYLERWSAKLPKIQQVLKMLGHATTQQCEIVSTLYAAWNDLLIEGKVPEDEEIINEASSPSRWHTAKAKIPAEKWAPALKWMNEHALVPIGFGCHTKHHS